jgi:ankyrin repeat protein
MDNSWLLKKLVDLRDGNGQTALHRATENGHDEIIRILIENGIDVNARDVNGQTALHLASKNGSGAAVGVLLGSPELKVYIYRRSCTDM